MEKLFVTISLISAAVLSAAVSHVAPEPVRSVVTHNEKQLVVAEVAFPEFMVTAPQVITAPQMDTLPKKKQQSSSMSIHSANVYSENEGLSTYNVHVDGKAYDIIQKNGKTTHLNIDGKEIPENEIATHQSEIDQIMAKVKIAHEEAEVHRAEADKHRAEADVRRKEAEGYRKAAEEQRLQADKMREQADLMRKDAEKQRVEADKYRAEADVARKRADEFRYEAEKDRAAYEQMQNDLISDLKAAGVIKSTSDLSYRLSQDELIVNGVKQPVELHKKLKEKYIQSKAVEMVYNYKGRTGYTTTGFIYTK